MYNFVNENIGIVTGKLVKKTRLKKKLLTHKYNLKFMLSLVIHNSSEFNPFFCTKFHLQSWNDPEIFSHRALHIMRPFKVCMPRVQFSKLDDYSGSRDDLPSHAGIPPIVSTFLAGGRSVLNE